VCAGVAEFDAPASPVRPKPMAKVVSGIRVTVPVPETGWTSVLVILSSVDGCSAEKNVSPECGVRASVK
jgi:hypothetical protein